MDNEFFLKLKIHNFNDESLQKLIRFEFLVSMLNVPIFERKIFTAVKF